MLIELAHKGDLGAIKELMDRTAGRSTQEIEIDADIKADIQKFKFKD